MLRGNDSVCTLFYFCCYPQQPPTAARYCLDQSATSILVTWPVSTNPRPVLSEGRVERDSLKTVCRLWLHNRVSLWIMLVNLKTDKFFVKSQVITSQAKNIGEIYRQIWTQHLWNRDSLNRKTNLQLDLCCYYCFCVVRIHLQEKSR